MKEEIETKKESIKKQCFNQYRDYDQILSVIDIQDYKINDKFDHYAVQGHQHQLK